MTLRSYNSCCCLLLLWTYHTSSISPFHFCIKFSLCPGCRLYLQRPHTPNQYWHYNIRSITSVYIYHLCCSSRNDWNQNNSILSRRLDCSLQRNNKPSGRVETGAARGRLETDLRSPDSQRLTWGYLTGPDRAVQEWHWLWGVSNTCYTLGDWILTAAWELPIPLSDCTLLPCVRLTLDANTGEQGAESKEGGGEKTGNNFTPPSHSTFLSVNSLSLGSSSRLKSWNNRRSLLTTSRRHQT